MLIRKTIHKAKHFFHKAFQNFKYFVNGEYRKLPKSPPFNRFCRRRSSSFQIHELGQYYADFPNNQESKKKSLMSLQELMKEEDACSGSLTWHEKQPLVKNKLKDRGNKKRTMGVSKQSKGEPSTSIGVCVLEQTMKELEKMEGGNEDHLLDIEEVLHYYSHLKSPVYLDIVNTFFRDMYSEFSLPQQ